MWQEKDSGDKYITYILRDTFPDGVLKAGLSCNIYDRRNTSGRMPLWMERSNPAKLDTLIEPASGSDVVKYRIALELFDKEKLEQEALQEQQKYLSGKYVLGVCPDDNDHSISAEKMRAIIREMQRLQSSHGVTFLTCQRTQKRGHRESSPNRSLDDQEIHLLLPYVQKIFETMEGLQLREPLRSPDYYQSLVVSLMIGYRSE